MRRIGWARSAALRRLRWCAACAAQLLAAGPLAAQEPAAALHGGVTTAAGERVPYALVTLQPGFADVFTDQLGRFVLAPVPAGTYRLRVRQVGFQPWDTTLTFASEPLRVSVVLRPVTLGLEPVTVTARPTCRTPGLPGEATAHQLATVYAEVRANAERLRVLATSYPYRYRMERTFVAYGADSLVVWSAQDTMDYAGDGTVRYRAGDVVRQGPGPDGTKTLVLNLPTLLDLADDDFIAHHCFYYGGVVEERGRRYLRVDFQALASLAFPDIEGEIDLDAQTYQIRRAVVRLTHPTRAVPGLRAAGSTVWFAEIRPNIVVPAWTEGHHRSVPSSGGSVTVARRSENQRLLTVQFVRALPDSAATP